MISSEILRIWAKEAGFAQMALVPPDDFDLSRTMVDAQPVIAERKQLRFSPAVDDSRIRSIAVMLWPYAQREMHEGRMLFVDSYYEASNAAYHAGRKLEERMAAAGHFAKANAAYPAREAAMRAGMGVIGKSGMLIHPQYGTRVFIMLMATDIEPDTHAETGKTRCLGCGKCQKACPSGAIDANGMSHPERCLRNFMMEGVVVPLRLRSAIGNRLLGCDICQRVCPMQPKTHEDGQQWMLDGFTDPDELRFSQHATSLAQKIGRNTARPQRIRAQAALICGNIGDERDLPALHRWAQSDFDAVREHALWAIERIEFRKKHPDLSVGQGLDQST